MPYITPDNVTSPQEHWQLDCVIYDGRDGGVSLSLGRWDGNQVIGIRWNGDENRTLGNPNLQAIQLGLFYHLDLE